MYQLQCVAPLKVPSPLNMTLISMFVFVRHGARAPIDAWGPEEIWGKWVCDSDDAISPQMYSMDTKYGPKRRIHSRLDERLIKFKPNCAGGQLITEGMRQHQELGQFYYDSYKEFLPETYDPELIYLRSSKSDRAIRSMISFVHGMYPPVTPDDIITFTSGGDKVEPLNPNEYGCPEYGKKYYEEFIKTDEFARRKERALKLQKPLYDYLKLEQSEENWMWLGDWIYSYYCSNQSIPSVITDEMFEVAMNDTSYYSVGFFKEYPDIASGPIWRLLLEAINDRLALANQYKFHFFSGHDTTIGSMLAKLGYSDLSGIPPYRSHILVELYNEERPTLRFSENGKVLKINGKETLTLTEFQRLVLPSLDKCME